MKINLAAIDIAVIVGYIVVINVIGLAFTRAKNADDYFLGSRNIPWPVACFSIVATETSTLTFISIPGLAYITNLGFLQIALGYIAGRFLVAWILLPRYFAGSIGTAYEFLQGRFGASSRRIIAVIFHITRLLADSIRLFATAIPLAMILGLDVYWPALLLIGAATFIYTYYGGITSVVIVDTIQLGLYLGCAVLGLFIVADIMGLPVISVFRMIPEKNLALFSSGIESGLGGFFGNYNIFSGLIGGALLSFASHGTDHLIVQRVLSCRDLASARKAMIASGFAVFFQFALFLIFGLFILVLLQGRSFEMPDKILPFFIVQYLPAGIRGLMLAGIFAAAMSTLSSSINSLSSSTFMDILRLHERESLRDRQVLVSRMISLGWTLVIVGFSMLLRDNRSPLVELGLGIASITYGGMLGIFIQGALFREFSDRAAISGVLVSIGVVAAAAKMGSLFWPWFVPLGFVVSLAVGSVINLFQQYLRNANS